jgi:hypothetical protein
MKHWVAVIIILAIIGLLILLAGYIFWATSGKDVVIRQIEDLTQGKATLGEFKIIPPFNNLIIKGLKIDGKGEADAVYISSGIIGFLTANIVLDEVRIIRPEFTYERFVPLEPPAPAPAGQAVPKAKPKPAARALRMISKRISIKDGKLVFIDHTAGKDGITITVTDIELNARTMYIFPRSLVAKVDLKGSIPWQTGCEQGKIRLEGWIDFFKRDMQANLNIQDIDGIYLYPYYAQYVDLSKSNIEKAKLKFTGNIQGLKNNLTADCHLELSDLVFKPKPPQEPKEKEEKLAAVVLDIFKDINQGKIVLDFTIRTKMDNPVFGFSNIKTAVESKVTEHIESRRPKIKNIVTLPITVPTDMMMGTVKGLTDVSVSAIRGTVSVLKELKDAFLAPFRRQKTPAPAPAATGQKK